MPAALPALEALHKAWSSCAEWDKYYDFADALQAGISKLDGYYDKTSSSNAYTFAMREYRYFLCIILLFA